MLYNLFTILDFLSGIAMIIPFPFLYIFFGIYLVVKGGWSLISTLSSINLATMLGVLDVIAGVTFLIMIKTEIKFWSFPLGIIMIAKAVILFISSGEGN